MSTAAVGGVGAAGLQLCMRLGDQPSEIGRGDDVSLMCVSLWQPWASLMSWLEKGIETRSWPCPFPPNQWIGIHAAKRWTGEEEALCRTEPFRSVLQRHGISHPKTELPFGAVVAVTRFISCRATQESDWTQHCSEKELAFGNYAPGRFGWHTGGTCVALPGPVPARGAQGPFRVAIPKASLPRAVVAHMRAEALP